MEARIQVVSHHPLVGRYLVQILASHGEFKDLVASPDVCQFDLLPPCAAPHLFVIDAYFLPQELSKVTRLLRIRCPESKFLALTPSGRSNDEQILRLLYQGVEGVVTVSEDFAEELVAAVKALLAGTIWAPRRVLAEYVRQTNWMRSEEFLSRFSITPREAQILQLVLRRFSNKEIAAALGIAERTVKFHASNIFNKMAVEDREDLMNLVSQDFRSGILRHGTVRPT